MVKTYKFESQAQTLRKVDVRVIKTIAEAEDFSLIEEMYNVGDSSQACIDLQKQLRLYASSLPLLLYNVKQVTALLEEYLTQVPKVCIRVMRVLTRELRAEFATVFLSSLMPKLVDICGKQELIKDLFAELSLCLKYLVKWIPPLDEIMPTLLPFLTHNNEHVRRLSAQCFAFIVRKTKSLQSVISNTEADLTSLFYYSAQGIQCGRILAELWVNPELAHKVHLTLCLHSQHLEEVWTSCTQTQAFSVLADWVRICNYARFPAEFDKRMNDFIQSTKSLEIAQFWLRARPRTVWLLEELMQGVDSETLVQFLGVLSDFSDLHTEQEVHVWLISKAVDNSFVSLDFSSVSTRVYSAVNETLKRGIEPGRNALGLLLWLRKKHTIGSGVVDLTPWASLISEKVDIWLAVRCVNELNLQFDCPERWESDSEEVATELGCYRKRISEPMTPAGVLAAARLGMDFDSEDSVLPYLSHPVLRSPACQVIRRVSPALELCWELVQGQADLATERIKILAMKKLQLLAAPDSKAVVKVLLGVFWERFTTLWKHVNECLFAFSTYNSNYLWEELRTILTGPDYIQSSHFPLYDKLVDESDFTPPTMYKECLLKFLAAYPAAVGNKTESFLDLFLDFLREYSTHYFVAGFSVAPQSSDLKSIISAVNGKSEKRPELNRQLTLFLKVIKELPDLSTQSTPLRKKISDFCLQLLLKKVEEIRVLATDCYIKIQCENDAELLRGLAKDETFKATAVGFTGPASRAALVLCAGRAFRKSPFSPAAFTFLAGVSNAEAVLEALPLTVTEEPHPEVLAACPIRRLSPLLRTLSALANKAPHILIPHISGVTSFALSVFSFCETQGDFYREVVRLALACLTSILTRFSEHLTYEDVGKIIKSLDRLFIVLATEYRPRVMDCLHVLLDKYRWVLPDRADLLSSYIQTLGRTHLEEGTRGVGFSLLVELFNDPETREFVDPLMDLIRTALVAKIKASGLSPTAFALAGVLPITADLRELADLLTPLTIKKPEVVSLVANWLPALDNYPLDFFIKNIPKHKPLLKLVSRLVPEPLSSIISDFTATTKSGLLDIDDFSIQLEALYRAFDLCDSMSLEHQRILLTALNHFCVGSELAKRAETAKILSKLTKVEVLWPDVLKVVNQGLKRCREDEELRTLLQVFQTYLDVSHRLETTWGDFRLLDSLAHLQTPTRVKAMKKLCEMTLPLDLEIAVFVPMLTYLIFFFKPGKQSSQAYPQALLTLLTRIAKDLPWKQVFTLLRIYAQKLQTSEEEKLLSRALAGLFEAMSPEMCAGHIVSLSQTVLPALKAHILERRETKSPIMRKFVTLAVFRYAGKLPIDEQSCELQRLSILLTRYIRHRDSGTRDSAIDCMQEVLKTGLLQTPIVRELSLHLSDDRELLAKALTKALITLPFLETEPARIASEVLLEYDQFPAFYYLGKLAQYSDLPLILTSTKPLQYIAKGLSENQGVSPIQMVELGLELMSHNAVKQPIPDAKARKKDLTFSIQKGAATGTRGESGIGKKVSYGDKVFAARLIKQGIHKAKNVPESLATRCISICKEGLNHPSDEVVMTSLEVLRAFKSPLALDRAIALGETSSGDMLIQALKYLSAVVKAFPCEETQGKRVLTIIAIGMESEASQPSALKLFRVLLEQGLMDAGIYDVMEQVPKLMLTNLSLRDSASSLYIDFLRSYPLSEKRKEFHVDFLMRNLEFPVSTGRLTVARAINLMMKELPPEGILKQGDFLLLSIITALANEDDEDCRKELEVALGRVIQLHTTTTVLSHIRGWAGNDRESMKKAAFLTMKILLDVGKPVPELTEVIATALQNPLSTDLRGCVLSLLETALDTGSIESTTGLGEAVASVIQKSLEEQKPASLRSLLLLHHFPLELAKQALKYTAESGNVLPYLPDLLLSVASESLVTYTSSLFRRQLGRGNQSPGVLFIVTALSSLVKAVQSAHPGVFKAVIIGADLAKTEELKEAVTDLFQELHSVLPAEEFLSIYNATKAAISAVREEKKNSLKQLIVSNPEA